MSQQQLVLQLQSPCPQLRSLHLILQCVNVDPLPVEAMEEFILLLVNICVPCTIAVHHGLSIHLDLGQILLHLGLLSLQTIPLKTTMIQTDHWNKGWRLTLVLSPARRPQS